VRKEKGIAWGIGKSRLRQRSGSRFGMEGEPNRLTISFPKPSADINQYISSNDTFAVLVSRDAVVAKLGGGTVIFDTLMCDVNLCVASVPV